MISMSNNNLYIGVLIYNKKGDDENTESDNIRSREREREVIYIYIHILRSSRVY